MQLGLLVVVVFLSSMDLTGSSKVVKGKRQRRSMYEMLFFSTSSHDVVNVFTTQEPTEIPQCHSPCPLTCHSSELQCPLRSQGVSLTPPAQGVPRAGQPGRIGTRAATVCPPLCKRMLELFYIKTVLN